MKSTNKKQHAVKSTMNKLAMTIGVLVDLYSCYRRPYRPQKLISVLVGL